MAPSASDESIEICHIYRDREISLLNILPMPHGRRAGVTERQTNVKGVFNVPGEKFVLMRESEGESISYRDRF